MDENISMQKDQLKKLSTLQNQQCPEFRKLKKDINIVLRDLTGLDTSVESKKCEQMIEDLGRTQAEVNDLTIVHRKELVERVSAVIEEMEAVSFPLTKANKQKIQAEVTHMKNCFEQLQESALESKEALLSLEDSVGLKNILTAYGKQMSDISKIIQSSGGVVQAELIKVFEELMKGQEELKGAIHSIVENQLKSPVQSPDSTSKTEIKSEAPSVAINEVKTEVAGVGSRIGHMNSFLADMLNFQKGTFGKFPDRMSWIEQTLQNVLTKRLFQDMFNDMKSEQSRIGHSTTDEINKMKVASENNGKIVDHLKNEMEKMRSKQEAYNNLLMQLSKEQANLRGEVGAIRHENNNFRCEVMTRLDEIREFEADRLIRDRDREREVYERFDQLNRDRLDDKREIIALFEELKNRLPERREFRSPSSDRKPSSDSDRKRNSVQSASPSRFLYRSSTAARSPDRHSSGDSDKRIVEIPKPPEFPLSDRYRSRSRDRSPIDLTGDRRKSREGSIGSLPRKRRKTEEETRSRSCSPDKVEITREKALSPERAPCTREKSMSLESIRSRESRTRSIELEEDYVRLKDTIWRDWKNIKDRNRNTIHDPKIKKYCLNVGTTIRSGYQREVIGHREFSHFQIPLTSTMVEDLNDLFEKCDYSPVELGVRIMKITGLRKEKFAKYPWKGPNKCLSTIRNAKDDRFDDRELVATRSQLIAIAIELNRYCHVRGLYSSRESPYFSPKNALHPDQIRMEYMVAAFVKQDFNLDS